MLNYHVPYNDRNWGIAVAILTIFANVKCDVTAKREIVFETRSQVTLESIQAAYQAQEEVA